MRKHDVTVLARFATIAATAWLATAGLGRTQPAEPTPTDRAAHEQLLTPPAGVPGGGPASGGMTGSGGVTISPPPLPSPVTDVKNVRASGSAPDPNRSSANSGILRGAQLVSIRDGEATLNVDGATRTLHVGDTIGGDIVRRIDSDRLVLGRPEGSQEGLVVVTFDATRHARVRVYTTTDPNPAMPASVK
jgi:hypothetical protein